MLHKLIWSVMLGPDSIDIHKEKKGQWSPLILLKSGERELTGLSNQGVQSGVGAIPIIGMLEQAAPEGAAEFSSHT